MLVAPGQVAAPPDQGVSDLLSDTDSVCSNDSFISDLDDTPQSVKLNIDNGSPLNDKDFLCIHFNINSIRSEGRLDILTDICNTTKCDCLILTETKIDQTIPNNILKIEGFHEPLRHDRTLCGGGTAIYIADHLTYKPQTDLQSDMFEHLWVDIKVAGKIYAVNALYRPSTQTSSEDYENFLSFSEVILRKLDNHTADNVIISSDMNYGNCYCKNPILNYKPLDNTAPELFQSFGYSQLLDIPTRVTDTSTSLLDLIYVHNTDSVTAHGTLPQISDHDGTFVSFHCTQDRPNKQTKQVFDYNDIDEPGLISYIKNIDYDSLVFTKPLQDQAQIMTDILTQAFSLFVPSKTIVISPSCQPWSNTYTRLLLRKKNRNYKLFKKLNNKYLNKLTQPNTPPEVLTALLNKKNKVFNTARESANQSTYANKRSKVNFYNGVNALMKNPNISAKKKFGILTKLLKNNKSSSIPPLIENNQTVTDPKLKGDILNQHFSSKSTVTGNDDVPPDLDKIPVTSEFNNLNTSPIEVAKIIRNIKRSKQSYCGVPGKFLSLISTPISFSLTKLFNNMFEHGHFPHNFKLAHVTSIWKQKGVKSSKQFYRPISLLPTLSKCVESIIHSRLLSHFTENNIISDKQAAYMRGDSTTNQLLYLVHQIRSAWHRGEVVQVAALDVHAAFDKVWHSGLLAKLDQIGVTGNCHKLFKSYLSDRRQIVVVDGVKSDVCQVKAGVPQGSRLGPLLFILYINDIQTNLESDILIYADDTTLLAVGKNPTDTSNMLNRDLTKINIWAETWKVTFQAEKSRDILFSEKPFLNHPQLTLNTEHIKQVTQHKHLGLILTSNLDWTPQVHAVCLKANRKLSVLRQAKYLQRQTLDLLYKITVRAVTDYGLPIFYHTLKLTDKNRLEQLQYKAAKLVTGALHLTSKDKLNAELGWETIAARADTLGLSIFYKTLIGENRPLIRQCMPAFAPITIHNTRHKAQFTPFPLGKLKFKNSFFPYFTQKFESLPDNVKKQPDIIQFKMAVKGFFCPKRYKFLSKGNKIENTLLTRIRVGRSYLHSHSFTIGLSDTPACHCTAHTESPQHFFLHCPLYTEERRTLLDTCEQYIPKFKSFPKERQFNIILHGFDPDNHELNHINSSLQYAAQRFVQQTKRFSH